MSAGSVTPHGTDALLCIALARFSTLRLHACNIALAELETLAHALLTPLGCATTSARLLHPMHPPGLDRGARSPDES
jgi:hypothetical protein